MFYDPGTNIEQCIREMLGSPEYIRLASDKDRARWIVAALDDSGRSGGNMLERIADKVLDYAHVGNVR